MIVQVALPGRRVVVGHLDSWDEHGVVLDGVRHAGPFYMKSVDPESVEAVDEPEVLAS